MGSKFLFILSSFQVLFHAFSIYCVLFVCKRLCSLDAFKVLQLYLTFLNFIKLCLFLCMCGSVICPVWLFIKPFNWRFHDSLILKIFLTLFFKYFCLFTFLSLFPFLLTGLLNKYKSKYFIPTYLFLFDTSFPSLYPRCV